MFDLVAINSIYMRAPLLCKYTESSLGSLDCVGCPNSQLLRAAQLAVLAGRRRCAAHQRDVLQRPAQRLRQLRRQQRLALRILLLAHLRPVVPVVPVHHALVVVHHAQDQRLVGGVDRRYADVAHRPELAAIVQVLVLQSEEVPDEATEDLQRSSDGDDAVAGDVLEFGEREADDPEEAQHKVLDDGEVVEPL